MFRLLLLLALFGTVTLADAQGLPSASPPAPAAAPVAAEDALKGVIWSKTAQYVWNANPTKAPAQRPVAWTSATEFRNWCNGPEAKADKSGLPVLKNQVMSSFGGSPASARQLADSIVATIKRAKDLALRKVDTKALTAELNNIPGVTVEAPTAAASPADTVPAEETPVSPVAAQPQPSVAPVAVPAAAQQPAGFGSFIAQNPAMTLGLTFLLGMIAGALLTMVYRRAQPEQLTGLEIQPLAEEPKPQKPKPSFRQLEQEAKQIKLATQQPTPPASPPATPPKKKSPDPNPTPVPGPPPAAIPVVEVSAPAVPAPPANWYAPAQEGGHIEVRKLVAEALPQLPIMLTIDARHPDRATFTLNPNANQGKLIGDGLEQLRDYFDYELPGRISSVTAAAPGQLVRQGDGWQVSTLARLEVR